MGEAEGMWEEGREQVGHEGGDAEMRQKEAEALCWVYRRREYTISGPKIETPTGPVFGIYNDVISRRISATIPKWQSTLYGDQLPIKCTYLGSWTDLEIGEDGQRWGVTVDRPPPILKDDIKPVKKRSKLQLEASFYQTEKQEIQQKKERIEFAKYQRKIENHDHDPIAGHLSIECFRNGLEQAERIGTEKNLRSWINKGRKLKHMEVL